ncbi:MAG: hypothetical protein IPJ02_18080 [Chitinophagaceae bacterium]|nr:hypothetical protein [Chitinophagaceae bacterium]
MQGRHGARSIDQLGHNLWDEADEQTQEKYDSQYFSNAVESVLLDHNSRTSMAEELAKYEEKGDEDWQNYYDQAHEGLEEDEQNQVDKAISILEGLTDEEIQQILDTEEAALADSEFLEQFSNQYDNPVSKEQAEKDKKLAEIEKDKQDKINKATKPEIQPEEQTKIEADLALTSEANRQQLDDIKQKLYSLRELVKCLWQ